MKSWKTIATVAGALIVLITSVRTAEAYPAWKHIGGAHGVRGMAAWKGNLYAITTDNSLYVRRAVAGAAPWKRIDMAFFGTALAAVNGYLYLTTSQNKLWRRPAVPHKSTWTQISSANYITGLGGHGSVLWAVTSRNVVWKTGTNAIRWQRAGHAYYGTSMTGYGGRLYLTTSRNELWTRPASGGAMQWSKLGTVNAATGFAISGGHFFVTTLHNKLWAAPLTSPTTVAAVSFPKYKRAAFRNKWPCSAGQFRDPRGGGQCWSCPGGYNRTLHAVTSTHACSRSIRGTAFRASKKGRGGGILRTDCPSGQFWDAWNGGWCWTCHGGNRSGAAVYASNACTRPARTVHARATYRGKPGCFGGSFHDPRHGGQCWSCPTGYSRKAFTAVTSTEACHRKTASACAMVFNELKGKLPRSPMADYGGRCGISFAQGMVCTLVPAIGRLAPPPSHNACSRLGFGVKQACSFVFGNLARVFSTIKCINKSVAAVKSKGGSISFGVGVRLSDSLCQSAGSLATTYIISKQLRGMAKRSKRKKLNDLVAAFEKARVLKGTIKAITAFKVLVQACADAL